MRRADLEIIMTRFFKKLEIWGWSDDAKSKLKKEKERKKLENCLTLS